MNVSLCPSHLTLKVTLVEFKDAKCQKQSNQSFKQLLASFALDLKTKEKQLKFMDSFMDD